MSNTQATVEDLIDELTDVLEKGWHLPFARYFSVYRIFENLFFFLRNFLKF